MNQKGAGATILGVDGKNNVAEILDPNEIEGRPS